jgi:hypothetical protein
MTSRRDLLEAQAFVRRRLLAVLVAGAPGGHEPDHATTGRWLLGGAVVGALLVVVVAGLALVR